MLASLSVSPARLALPAFEQKVCNVGIPGVQLGGHQLGEAGRVLALAPEVRLPLPGGPGVLLPLDLEHGLELVAGRPQAGVDGLEI